GLWRPGDNRVPPTGFVINANLKIERRYDQLGPSQLAFAVINDCQNAAAEHQRRNEQPRVITEMPPALIIRNALTPELARKCIEAFRTGHRFEGTVGANENMAYRPNAKIRTDHIIQGPLLDEIDDKFSRSVFPEIRKIFGFQVGYREIYKVGSYIGEKGGFFKAHRDNFDIPLGYRRLAMTVNLNDDYEGGGLSFPEYGSDVFRPTAGGAVVFPCSMSHEARPVTAGERIVLVCFFHGEEEESFRRHHLASKNKPFRIKDYKAKLYERPDIRESRRFYAEWHKKHVRFDGQGEK
ncbi:MAG: 2OG-Fe(II) oxygenase, partial [Pseudomonadota bacterium]|nr:2OG-Fe(II) oxygenase [Pseudomonadota bacterium]